MTKKIIATVLTFICLAHTSLALNSSDVKLGGTYMGVYNTFSGTALNSQFDYATNLDFNLRFSDRISGIVQVQGGVGNGSLGFVGPEAVITDLNINYVTDTGAVITAGSFDLPFGNSVNYLVNNADATASPFLVNSLIYSALAGPVGTLNTVGLKYSGSHSHFDSVFTVTNGTAEDALNAGNTAQYLLSLSKKFGKLYLGATYTFSDDQADIADETTNSFDTLFSAYLVDINYEFSDRVAFKSHAGVLSYDDETADTTDDVFVASLELSRELTNGHIACRLSSWQPDSEGTSGYSSDLSMPGLSGSDEQIGHSQRLQFAYSKEVQHNLSFRADLVIDNYEHSDSITGIITGFNGHF